MYKPPLDEAEEEEAGREEAREDEVEEGWRAW